MKTRFTLLLALVAMFLSTNAQQLTNAGFNTWTNASNPDGWSTWATATIAFGGIGGALATRDTADKVEGSASVKIITDSVQAGPSKQLIPGIANYGAFFYTPPSPRLLGTPYTFRPDTILFGYKYVPAGLDTAYLEIQVSGDNGTNLLLGRVPLTSTAGQWAGVFLPLTSQLAAGTVDSIRLTFGSSSGAAKRGSVLHVDAVTIVAAAPTVEYNVLTAALPANGGTTTGFGSYNGGTSVTVTATPNSGFVFNNWKANGTIVSTTASFTFTVNSDTSLVANFSPSVGISDFANATISIYPNPVNDVLNVAIENTTSTVNSSVIDITGKIVATQILGNGANSVNLSTVANGVYILRIVDNAGNTVRQERFNVAK